MKNKFYSWVTAVLFLFSLMQLEAISKVSFDDSMSCITEYQPQVAATDHRWQLLKSLYENYQKRSCLADGYTIPKFIHLIWLGSPLPERCKAIVSSWEKYHPDWTVKVWTDADAASFRLTNQIAFDRAQNYGEKSDILRYEILYRIGGLYVDTDFECLQSFDDLHKSCEFYTGIGQSINPQLWIGLIGSRPGHPILKATIDNLRMGPGDQDFERIMNDTGAYLFTRMFFEIAPNCPHGTIIPFPVTYFYPFPGGQRHRKDYENIKREFIKPNTMAIHYFSTSWQ